jgi:hypothetical protein
LPNKQQLIVRGPCPTGITGPVTAIITPL